MSSTGPWRQYKAPNGRKYYYNAETKTTTWINPFRTQKTTKKAVFSIPLLNDWYLIIYDSGEKIWLFNNVLYSRLNDPDSLQLLEQLDKSLLVLLIGISRGYISSRGADYVYEKILQEIQDIKDQWNNEILVDPKESGENDTGTHEEQIKGGEEEKEEAKDVEEISESKSTIDTLISGYSSSEDDEIEDNEHVNKQRKIEDEFSGSKLDESIINQYKKMFTRYKLNPYSLWSFEMDKCSKDPVFYLIVDDNDREMVFESWCGDFQINTDLNSSKDEINNSDEDEEQEQEDDDDDLIPTRFHYLSHIISKSTIKRETIFEDIKREQKPLWKQFKINKIIPDKKEQREFVMKILFYYKKYTLEERHKLFLNWITKNCKLEHNATDKLKLPISTTNHWKELHIRKDSSRDTETLLLSLEKYLHISEVLEDENINPLGYYLLGIKDKCDVLYNVVIK
ncbi:hypothetical protein RI543_000662 [Arxiozyma heterogenica]|uniref:WW domain-containing protein n=1 Tax=Arxiozyma heterogenica TaxID=278026 RepID=A0AAN7WU23_9SACH|nr:hypothetical protein RI543_000662 [Kazachstania heterogenica]